MRSLRRGRRGVLLAVSIACAAIVAPTSGAQTVRLTIDRAELTLEEQAVLALTVEGGSGEPKLPSIDGLEARYHGDEQRFSLVNGRMSRGVTYRWILLPKETGEFEIGPAEVEIRGRIHRSNSFTVRVLPASSQPRAERPMFVTASVSNRRPFVGEQVLYVWRFYRRARVADPRLDTLDLGPFLVEDLGDVRQYRTTEGGLEYEVSEIRKALFAQHPGTITIPASRLQVQLVRSVRRELDPFDGRISSPFDEFFGRLRTESHVLVTEPLTIEVRALPPAPAAFSGLVGTFAIESSVSVTSLEVGESLTQRIKVSGTGNLHLMGDLPLDELDGFKVYRDQPAVEIERSGARLTGTKTFTRALVPLRVGEVALPATSLVYFDPAAERYVTAAAPAVALEVAPGTGSEELRLTEAMSSSRGKVAVRILADDVLPIYSGLDPVEPRATAALLPILLAVPPLAYLGLLVARRRADRHASDAGLKRRRAALRVALREIRSGPAEIEPSLASGVLRRYAGDRLGAEGGAFTARECVERLAAAGVGDGLAAEVRAFFARLEAAGYGGSSDALVQAAELRGLLERLERELRRERGCG
ncbi:MAG TPA: BatD family protein [Thermoanaerobaculia bacterium]|nr:BatD family protein [Thermoanaerobaculia bacterium]